MRSLTGAQIERPEASCKLELYQAFLLSLELELWHDEDDCLHRAGRFASVLATVSIRISNRPANGQPI